MESSQSPKILGLFAFLKERTGIPPFIFIIFIIVGAVIFFNTIFVYLFLVALGYIILTMVSHQIQSSGNNGTTSYFDEPEFYKDPDSSSTLSGNNIENFQSEIKSLKSQISDLKKNYNRSIEELDSKLIDLEKKLNNIDESKEEKEIELPETITAINTSYQKAAHKPFLDKKDEVEKNKIAKEKVTVEFSEKSEDVLEKDHIDIEKKEKYGTPPPPPVFNVKKDEIKIEKTTKEENEIYIDSLLKPVEKEKEKVSSFSEDDKDESIVFKEKEKREPVFVKILTSLLGGIGEQVSQSLFGPFSAVLGKGKDLYKYYKDQGKLPVFYLTTAGTIALLLCFAYLLQYSFTNIFNEAAKMIIGFVSAGGLVIGGHVLNRKKGLKEFGSVLIGAGISLNFLLIYYLSIVYSFIPPLVGFGLLAINTIVGYLLSMRYETKITMIVSLLGGAFTPILLGAEKEFTTFYLFYLVMISATTIHVARKINWPTMAQVSVIIVTTLFQFILSKGDKQTFQLIPIHILFYLYMGYVFFREGKLQDKFSKVIALILVGNISALLYNTYTLSSGLLQGVIFLSNAIPFALASKFLWRIMTDLIKTIVLSIVSLFVLLSIPALIGLDIGSYVWVVEGLLMVYLGYHLKLNAVVKEGYTLFFISLFHACWGLGKIFTYETGIILSQSHIISFLAIPLSTAAMGFITELYKDKFSIIDKLVNRVSHTFVFFGTIVATFIISYFFVPDYSVFILLPIILAVSIYGSNFDVLLPKFSIKLIHIVAIPIMLNFSKDNYDIITPLLWTLEILFILWGTLQLKLNEARTSQYILFYWSILTGLTFTINSLDTSHLNHIMFFSLSIAPFFVLNGGFILLLSKYKVDFKTSDIFVKTLSHIFIWGWIPAATIIGSYFYIKDQAIILVLFSFLLSSFYANKFRVYIGRSLMPVLYLFILVNGVAAILKDSFYIDLSIIQFVVFSMIAALYIPLNKYLFKDHNFEEKLLINSIKEFLVGSSILTSMVISVMINSQYQIFGIALLIPVLLWVTDRFRIRLASFYLQPVLTGLMIVSSVLYIITNSSSPINSYFITMSLILAYSIIIDLFYTKKLLVAEFKFTKFLNFYSREMVSFIPTIFFFVVVYKLAQQWFWISSIIPMVYLLVRGSKTKSLISQYAGFIMLLFPISGYFENAIERGSFLVIYLPITGKIAVAEIALYFWGMMHFAKKINLHNTLTKGGKLMNILFFIFLPLSYIPTLFEIAPSLLSVSLLSSIAIAYLVSRFIKAKLFYYEFMLIWIGSFIVTVFRILSGTGELISPDTIALVGVIAFAVIHLIIEKSYLEDKYKVSPYKILFRIYWLSFSVLFVLVPLSLLNSLEAAALGFTAWYFIICRFANKIPAIKKISALMFKVTGWALYPILAVTAFQVFNNRETAVNLITAFISVIGICITLYASKQSVANLNIDLTKYLGIPNKVLLWTVHISVTAFLMSLSNVFPEDYIRPAQSILLLLHAVFLTFHSYSRGYQILIRYGAMLYFVFTLKVIFIDLATFSIPQKVFVFMVISLLMLGASYILQKRGMTWSVVEEKVKD